MVQPLRLPEGVSYATWAREVEEVQNPRLRGFLGCIGMFERALESNYAVLHCSPARVAELWQTVEKVGQLIREEIEPLLQVESCVPELESARLSALMGLQVLNSRVLVKIDEFPEEFSTETLLEMRKFLCVAIGELHTFLLDTMGKLLAGDLRSSRDEDYYLSKRFPRDIEEAEWLYSQVYRLNGYVQGLSADRNRHLQALERLLATDPTLPVDADWQENEKFLRRVIDDLTPRLKHTLGLQGIRYDDMESLSDYAERLPVLCHELLVLREAGREAVEQVKRIAEADAGERERSVDYLLSTHRVFAARMASVARSIEKLLKDLAAFLPIWLQGIERRRALLLVRRSRT